MNQNQIDALRAISGMALRFANRAQRQQDATAFKTLSNSLQSLAGGNTTAAKPVEKTNQLVAFTSGDHSMLRKALVTARRVEIGHAKTAVKHLDDAAEALAKKQAEIYSGLITKIDDARK